MLTAFIELEGEGISLMDERNFPKKKNYTLSF